MNLFRRLSASLVLCVMILPSVHAGPIVFSQSAIVVDDPALTTQAFAFGSAVMTVSADPREFSRKTVGAGVDESTGVGVSGGNVTGEIDPNGAGGVSSEKISFLWDVPVIVDSLNISFLYPDGQFGDAGNEQALVTALPLVGPPILLLLEATGETTGTWAGGGVLENVTRARDGSPGPAGGGEWKVSGDLFGTSIFFLSLSSPSPSAGAGRDSDFSFVELQGANVSVPEPSALALLGVALAGLGFRQRRKTD